MATAADLAGAIFSPCRKYRYLLWRDLGRGNGTLVCCALNPSTADELTNDPTCARMMKRAGMLGFRRFEMVNLFAWRSTSPRNLRMQNDPVGPENNRYILEAATSSTMFVCAWGESSILIPKRAAAVIELLADANITLHAMDVTKSGQPAHPLYMPYSLHPLPWRQVK